MTTKRKIVCPDCKAKIKFDPDKITSDVVKFNCPSCTSVLRIRKANLQERSASPSPVNQVEQEAGTNLEDPGGEVPGQDTSEITKVHPPDDKAEETEAVERQADPELSEETAKGVPGSRKPTPGETDDTEWTQFADKKGAQSAKSNIDMNELPASAPGLKETLASLHRAETYNLQGETHIKNKSYNQAVNDFSQAIEINPDYVDAIINRGRAFIELGRFNDALLDFNHALQIEKYDAELYNMRGEIYLQNNMSDQAIKDFTKALILDPMCSNAYLNRGRAYSEKGMQEEAMTDFDQAVRADYDKTSFSYTGPAVSEVFADKENRAGKEEARKFYEQGVTDLENEKYVEAVDNFSRAITLSSADAESYINRGRAYIKLEQPDKAMDDFNHAALCDPLNSSLYFWRALAWKAKDEPSNMAEDLKLSCELGYKPACLEYSKRKPPKK